MFKNRHEEAHCHNLITRQLFDDKSELHDCLCGLVVRVLATDLEVPGSIPGATTFSDK
jgi:hypothetical protein